MTVLLIKVPTTSTNIPSIRSNDQIIKYSSTAQHIGIIFNTPLHYQNSLIVHSINRIIRLIRPYITTNLAQIVATYLIRYRIDYCNYTLHRLSLNSITPFNKLLYSAARIVFRNPNYSRTDIIPYLKTLHWLPITQRIQYKIILLTYLDAHLNKPD